VNQVFHLSIATRTGTERRINMIFSNFLYLSIEQRKLLREKVFKLLESYGVKLDLHPQIFKKLKNANLQVDEVNRIVRFPSRILEKLLQKGIQPSNA
jgi:trimethylamine:corrinoid methyltransferase-like protein